jgi:hypothetical protein
VVALPRQLTGYHLHDLPEAVPAPVGRQELVAQVPVEHVEAPVHVEIAVPAHRLPQADYWWGVGYYKRSNKLSKLGKFDKPEVLNSQTTALLDT